MLAVLCLATIAAGVATRRSTERASAADLASTAVASARTKVEAEHLALQMYQVQQTPTAAVAFTRAADETGLAMRDIPMADAVNRLTAMQATYRSGANQLITLTAAGKSTAEFERSTLLPAFAAMTAEMASLATSTGQRQSDAVESVATVHVVLFCCVGLLLAMSFVLLHRLGRIAVAAADDPSKPDVVPEGHDPVTGLPGERLLHERLNDLLAVNGSEQGQGIGVLVVRLNEVDNLRYLHGQHACDQLVVAAAKRIRRALRDADMLARTAESDFGILLVEAGDPASTEAVAGRLEQILARPFRLQSGPASITPSIGAAFGDLDTPETLLQRANAAMYRAGSSGGLVVSVREPARRPTTTDLSVPLAALLSNGDPTGQLTLGYRPVVGIAEAAVTGMEAVPWWHHPEHGRLEPEEFIPTASAAGLIAPLTMHLLTMASAQAAAWQRAGCPMPIWLRVSPFCLTDPWFVSGIGTLVERAQLRRGLLGVELGLDGTGLDPQSMIELLRRVRQDGLVVRLDRFGSGLGQAAGLDRLPADELSLDPVLVAELNDQPENQQVLRTAIVTAHGAGLSVLADGVTDPGMLVPLRRMECDLAKGSLFGEPVPPEHVPTACERIQSHLRMALTGVDIR